MAKSRYTSISIDPNKKVRLNKAKVESALNKLITKLDAFDDQTASMAEIVGNSAVSGNAVDAIGESILKLAGTAQEYSILIRGFKEDILHYCENVSDMDEAVANQFDSVQ